MDTLQSLLSLPEGGSYLVIALVIVKRIIALIGTLVILWGAFRAFYLYFCTFQRGVKKPETVDRVRFEFGQAIVLGLEFIVAADVIETTMAPDYYSLGILGGLVAIRTVLSYFLGREIKVLQATR